VAVVDDEVQGPRGNLNAPSARQPGFHAGLRELLIERREHRDLTNGVLPRQSGHQLNRLVPVALRSGCATKPMAESQY
jgi:hypothetical protein